VEIRRSLGESAGGDSVGTHSLPRLSSLNPVQQNRIGSNASLGNKTGMSRGGAQPVKAPIIRVHDLEIDTTTRLVKRAGKAIHLTPREYSLLELLAVHLGKIVSRAMVWEHLYDDFDHHTSNVVDVYIRHLRTKIDKEFTPPLIMTSRGRGYGLRGAGDQT
jgi:DNA-binding response OmpR family regulator